MITQQQIDIIINTLMPYNPTKIGIFGSYALDKETDKSDLDILYSFSSKYSLFDLGGLYEDLKLKLNMDIDLVEINSIHPELKNSILSDAKMIYRNE